MSSPVIALSSLTIKIPKVQKVKDVDDFDIDSDDLPLGIKLTGGLKLRQDGLTGKGVRVAVIDSGVDRYHPGFNGRVTKQMWFRSGTPLSEDDHGTHVAGTIHMMAPDAEIYDYRVFGDEGFDVDEAISISIFEACFDGCDIINMSLGGRFASSGIRTAVQYAHSKGVIVVCAAGNEGDDNPLTNERSFPALWEEAICVAAVSKEDNLPVAYFSNTNPHVDYSGIGVDVVSFKPDGGFQQMNGTSMACPHVCGFLTALLDKEKGYLSAVEEVIIEVGSHDEPVKGDKYLRKLINEKYVNFVTALLDKENGYLGGVEEVTTEAGSEDKPVKGDKYLRKLINEKYVIDIGVKGPDNATGLGFLTYLSKEEFAGFWEGN